MRPPRFLPRLAATALALGISAAAHAAAPVKFSAAAGEVRDLVVVSASVGYAGTMGGGLWKTSDAGANWSKTSLPAKTVWKVAANPNSAGARLYAATESGLYRSTDSGSTWTRLTQDATRAVAVSPGSAAGGPDTLLVGVYGAGAYKSTDSGDTLVRSSSGLDSTDFVGIVWQTGSSSIAFAALNCNTEDLVAPIFEGPWGGVFRTADGGATWSDVTGAIPHPGTTRPCITGIAANGTAGTPITALGVRNPDNQGTSYHYAGGTTWTASGSDPAGVEWIGPDFANTSGFWRASSHYGVQRSTNGDVSYVDITTAGLDPDFVTIGRSAASFTATTWVAGINGIGLFRTTTGAGPWNIPATPIRADRVNDLANHDATLVNTYYMALKNGGVMKSTDGGVNWAEFDNGLSDGLGFIQNIETVGAHPANGNVVAIGLRAYGLYQLTGGTTWAGVAPFAGNPEDNKPQSIVMTPGGKVFYSLFDGSPASVGGLYRSTATGTTIGTLGATGAPSDGGPILSGSYRVRLGAAPDSRMYLMMYDSRAFRSNDGGVNWARVGATGPGFQNLAFIDVAEKNTVVVVASTNKGIYRSLDGGANFFSLATTGLPETTLAAIAYTPAGTLFGATFSGVMYCSTSDAASWIPVTGGDLGARVRDIKYLNGSIHVLTDGAGIWKKDAACS